MSAPTVYAASSVKRVRATKAEMVERRDRLYEIVQTDRPMTVRHAYYRAVVAGIVPKNDSGYGKVQRALAEMRLDGTIPFSWIVDNARWMRKPSTFDSIEDALSDVAAFYRRDLWAHSPVRVEVWCESDSIAGVLYEVTARHVVPLFPVRGFSSLSFAHSAAEHANHDGRDLVVYYVGDLDPAGLDIEHALVRHLREWLRVELTWQRVGVTAEQAEALDLPGTTPKKSFFYPLAVEAEALPAPTLRAVLEGRIGQWLNQREVQVLQEAERSEREILRRLAAGGLR
jgi:hypothetical protein